MSAFNFSLNKNSETQNEDISMMNGVPDSILPNTNKVDNIECEIRKVRKNAVNKKTQNGGGEVQNLPSTPLPFV